MAVPVISGYQSVLGALQYRVFAFQPYASNTPTSWTASPLPPGITLNGGTGRLTGGVTIPGVYNFSLTAHNADGASDPLVFSMGIKAAPKELDKDILEVNIDIPSRTVTMKADARLDGYKSANATRPAPIMFAKRGDIILMRVRFYRGETIADIPINSFIFGMKNLEPESLLAESVDNFARTVDTTNGDIYFTIRVAFTKDELRGALADTEGDDATFFVGLAEFTWEFDNDVPPSVLPDDHCRTTSQTFGVLLPRDLVDEVDD